MGWRLKFATDLSTGAISDDLERNLTLFSRSGLSLTLNISQTGNGYGYCLVFMQSALFAIAKFLFSKTHGGPPISMGYSIEWKLDARQFQWCHIQNLLVLLR